RDPDLDGGGPAHQRPGRRPRDLARVPVPHHPQRHAPGHAGPRGLRLLERPRRAAARPGRHARDGGARRVTSPATPAIVLRADASHDLGIGHVARLSALIDYTERAGAEPIVMFGGDATVAAWTQ